MTFRNLVFLVGAIGAAAEAIELATTNKAVTTTHLVAVVCVALVAYAAKWPSDVTHTEAREREARARRESMFPPPVDEDAQRYVDELLRKTPRELIDVPGGSHTLVPRSQKDKP